MLLSETYDDLEAYLADDRLEEEPIDDPGQLDEDRVNRFIRAIAARRRRQEEAEHVAAAEIRRVQDWLADQARRNSTEQLEEILAGYHRARLALNPRAKTLRLPAGDLVARDQPLQWTFEDDSFLAWAREHRPDLIRTTDAPAKVDVKRELAANVIPVEDELWVMDEHGMRIPGLQVAAGGTKFDVKLPRDERF